MYPEKHGHCVGRLHEGNRRLSGATNSVARYCNLVLLGKVLLSLDLEPKLDW